MEAVQKTFTNCLTSTTSDRIRNTFDQEDHVSLSTNAGVASNVGQSKRKRNFESPVWNHFSRTKNGKGNVINVCEHDHCGQQFSVSNSASTLWNHLKKYGFFLENLNQHRFGNSEKLVQTYPVPSTKEQMKYELLLCKWIAHSMKTFRIIKSKTQSLEKKSFF